MGNDNKGWSRPVQYRQYMLLELNVAMPTAHPSINASTDERIDNGVEGT